MSREPGKYLDRYPRVYRARQGEVPDPREGRNRWSDLRPRGSCDEALPEGCRGRYLVLPHPDDRERCRGDRRDRRLEDAPELRPEGMLDLLGPGAHLPVLGRKDSGVEVSVRHLEPADLLEACPPSVVRLDRKRVCHDDADDARCSARSPPDVHATGRRGRQRVDLPNRPGRSVDLPDRHVRTERDDARGRDAARGRDRRRNAERRSYPLRSLSGPGLLG